jgi:hypothetical protein
MMKRRVMGLLLLPGIVVIWMFGWLLYSSPQKPPKHSVAPFTSAQQTSQKVKDGLQFVPLAA